MVGFGLLALGTVGLLVLASIKAPSAKIVDRRKFAQLTPEAAAHTSKRKASDVHALVLHQMGFNRGNDPTKYNLVTAHYLILPDGGTYQLHDHTTRLPASSSLNSGSVSVEFAGNFPARARATDPAAFVKPEKYGMDQLTPEQIQAGRALVAHLRKPSGKRPGITHIHAHRQGGGKRENCPGPDVWREVGAWAVNQYGLKWGGEGWAVMHGSPIPDQWWSPPGGQEVA